MDMHFLNTNTHLHGKYKLQRITHYCVVQDFNMLNT